MGGFDQQFVGGIHIMKLMKNGEYVEFFDGFHLTGVNNFVESMEY
jgi:hypothetical protein